jgi:hypothetical protein
LILALWVGCLLPTEIFALIYWIIQPTSDVAKVLIFGIGVWVGGALQIGGIILGVCLSVVMISDATIQRRSIRWQQRRNAGRY